MPFYGCHTTYKSQRDYLMSQEGERIMVPPEALQRRFKGHKPIIIEEGTNYEYEQRTGEFFEILDDIYNGREVNPEETKYYKLYPYKGKDITNRVARLPGLFNSIRKDGVKSPIHVEATGERLDGSFRTKIALYLGIKEVPAILHKFRYTDMDDEFIERKLRARELSSGKPDYYEFSYNDKWKNGTAGSIHRENAERWSTIKELAVGSVVDVGCNEGYIGLQLARHGHHVWGLDHDQIHLANLNKLIFEYVDQKELPIEFHEGDIATADFPKADTVLLLNIIYHFPKEKQVEILHKLHGRIYIFQCNLRKAHVRNEYYGSHPDDLKELAERAGLKVIREIAWKDKPIIICR